MTQGGGGGLALGAEPTLPRSAQTSVVPLCVTISKRVVEKAARPMRMLRPMMTLRDVRIRRSG